MTVPTKAVVHPVVLLSVVDHFNRVARNTTRRVVGVLLGEVARDGNVDIRNSYAVPFEEDERNPDIFFLDHNFHEAMFAMFKKVQANEKVIGWYHTGPKIRSSDLKINDIFKEYVTNPVLVIVDVKPKDVGLPVEAYYAVEEIKEDGTESRKTFASVPAEIGALEAEEVGVEHLLRDIKDSTVSSLSTEVHAKVSALMGLKERLQEISQYVDNVLNGSMPVNHDIIAQLQDIFNLLPNLRQEELVRAFAVKTNDNMVVVYLASLVRSVIALHNLINNKLVCKAQENKLDNPTAETPAAGAAAAADAKDGKDGDKDKKGKGEAGKDKEKEKAKKSS